MVKFLYKLIILRKIRAITVTFNEQGAIIDRAKVNADCFSEVIGTTAFDMVVIPAGAFLMGSPEGEGDSDERPQHRVTIKSFAMSRLLVTQSQWRAVAALPKVAIDINDNPSQFLGADLPVESLTWFEAMEFCARLSRHTERRYRLPSESEWEYACRAGTQTPFAFGETISSKIANFDGNAQYRVKRRGIYRQQTTPAGSLKVANRFGLFDMHGNVWEWCRDVWHDNYEGAPSEGSAWIEGGNQNLRVVRGGSWDYPAYGCRSAFRDRANPTIRSPFNGLRIVAEI